MAQAQGAYAERVEKPADLPDALVRARDAVVSGKRQALLNVITPISETCGPAAMEPPRTLC